MIRHRPCCDPGFCAAIEARTPWRIQEHSCRTARHRDRQSLRIPMHRYRRRVKRAWAFFSGKHWQADWTILSRQTPLLNPGIRRAAGQFPRRSNRRHTAVILPPRALLRNRNRHCETGVAWLIKDGKFGAATLALAAKTFRSTAAWCGSPITRFERSIGNFQSATAVQPRPLGCGRRRHGRINRQPILRLTRSTNY